MKPFLPAVLAITALVPAAFLVACGGDDAEDDATPIVLQQSDRDRITQMSTDYLRALAARDMAAAKAQLPAGVPDQTVTNAMNTVRDEGLTFQRVGGIEVDGQEVKVALELTGPGGSAVQRSFEFKLEDGEWRLWSPQLKPAIKAK